jgi:hypothetical protein
VISSQQVSLEIYYSLKKFLQKVELRKFLRLEGLHCLIEVRNILMKTRATFASRIRLHAVLCSAAILLSACGGAADTSNGQQVLAADIVISPTAGAAGTAPANVAAPGAGAVSSESAPAPVAVSQAEINATAPELATPVAAPAVNGDASVAANPAAASTAPAANFDLSGYQPADPAAGANSAQAPQAAY